MGSPKASRAVGQALKNNPYPLIIPCHRVVKSDKQIGGYALGVKRKNMLLNLEKRIVLCLQSKE
jgi:methylated-DNA-[protein]-cysteine S-methyltransferase